MKLSMEYFERLISASDYSSLVELSSYMCSSAAFTMKAADYGLPSSAFVFVEGLSWFAQSIRSGAWTYFEATPSERQQLMHSALVQFAPAEFAATYSQGIRDWKDESLMESVDGWITANDQRANDWMHEHVIQYRELVQELVS